MAISHAFNRAAVAGAALFLTAADVSNRAGKRRGSADLHFRPLHTLHLRGPRQRGSYRDVYDQSPERRLVHNDIVVTGTGQEAGTYEPQESGDNVLLYVDSATSNDLFLRFNENLGAANLQLTRVDWVGAGSSTAVELGGGAQLPAAAPEPSTWAMMLIGFTGLGYAALRRQGAPCARSPA